jgi:Holliday junction DNA helicase RuvA
MIDFVRGKVASANESRIVLDVQGMGYGIDVPASVAATARPGEELLLHTELLVREDALQLVGFATQQQRQLFRSLVSVSGIGPKVALKALGSIEPEELAGAIVQGDLARLTRLPGVGKKTAQVLVATLADSMAKLRPGLSASGQRPVTAPLARTTSVDDALLALLALGMNEGRARQNLSRASESLGDQAPTAALVTAALRQA